MKIGIITVYYSENCGTILQVYAIGKVINQLGYETVCISTKNKYSSHSIKLTGGRIVKELLRGNFKNAIAAVKKYYYFAKLVKMFNVIDMDDAAKNGIQKFVVGSDTVWNVEDNYFKESFKQFWPIVDNIKVVSYAAAVENSSIDAMKKLEFAKTCLTRMDMISVRDQYSKKVINSMVDKQISVVVDPTILIDIKEFDVFKKELKLIKKYILIYVFQELDMSIVKDIVSYAEINNLELVSLGKKIKWCNRQVIISVENFVSYFSNAEYVITNTFHGNVFSILYNRQFICSPCEKMKIIELLASLGLENRRISSTEDIKDIMTICIDYNNVNLIIKELKESSMCYLNAALEI